MDITKCPECGGKLVKDECAGDYTAYTCKKCKKRFLDMVVPLDPSASADFERELRVDLSEVAKPLTRLLLPDETLVADPKLENYSPIYFAIESIVLDCWDSDRSIKDADVLDAYGKLLKDLDAHPKSSITAEISESIKAMLSHLKNKENRRYTKGELRSCLSFLIGIVHSHESPLGDGYLRWVRTFFRGRMPRTEKEHFDYIRDNESEFAKPLKALGWEEIPGSRAIPRTADAMDARPKIKIGRNDPCPCGSGKKYKKCCLGKAGS